MRETSDNSPGFGVLVALIIFALIVIIAVLFASYKTSGNNAPGFGALVALIGLGAVAFLIVRKH
ncbi:MAG: hypothetical protein MCSN_3790 [Candidatus Microsyncoccus archaeolyticus]|jgi:PGF-CTERM protein|nr:MAG: hypothetical protein MCSN_3790 [Candidatus Parcubacteria bacterium]